MSWARIDDAWWSHPKVLGVSLAASGLWARALSWSCHQRKDEVPRHFLAVVGATEDQAEELVRVGLWHDRGDVWTIHDWAQYQDMSLSEKRAAAGAKGGKKSGEARRSKQNSEATAKQTKQRVEANDEAGTRPVPSRPSMGRKRPLPDGWEPNDKHTAKAKQNALDVTVEAEQFTSFHASKGSQFVDWDAAFNTWLGNAVKFRKERNPHAGRDHGADEWLANA